MVCDDFIGGIALCLEFHRGSKARFASNRLRFKVGNPGVDLRRGSARCLVRSDPDPFPLSGRFSANDQSTHAVPLLNQGWRKVFKLAGEVLVDKKDVHENDRIPIFASHARLRST